MSSLLFDYPAVSDLRLKTRAIRQHLYMGDFCGESDKSLVLHGTSSWLGLFGEVVQCIKGSAQRNRSKGCLVVNH
eukprot:8900689-Alexandrium_andersonii.AAC.1